MFDTLRRLINQLLQRTGNKPSVMDTHQLKKQISELTSGLLYFSESEYPFELLDWNSQEPDQVRAKILSRHAPDAALTELSTNDFFQKIIRNMNNGGDEAMVAVGARYKTLFDFISANTSSSSVWRCGKIEIGIYIVMITKDGHSLALHTTSIET